MIYVNLYFTEKPLKGCEINKYEYELDKKRDLVLFMSRQKFNGHFENIFFTANKILRGNIIGIITNNSDKTMFTTNKLLLINLVINY